jgi:catechol 2,3-dioxygenase-like lactoylglutathione lyase family enzyme
MMKRWSWAPAALAVALVAGPVAGQVSMDSWHLNSFNVGATKNILVAMGGTATSTTIGDVIEFPGVKVYLYVEDAMAPPTGGTVGSVVDHVGFTVPNVEAAVAKWKAAGVPVELARATQAWVVTQEGFRIEILQNAEQTNPIQHQHVHYNVPQAAIADAQKWYSEVFGAVPGKRGNFDGANIPGAHLTFAGVTETKVGTRGRVLDHIGFRVQGLEALCSRLQGMAGVQLDRPCQKDANGVVKAILTDPWGTRIELTEGGPSTN